MWQDDAACAGMDSEIFFPSVGGGASVAATLEAKKICGRCPVTAECLRVAVEWEEQYPPHDKDKYHGVYGGLSGRERMMLRGA